jgi:hypothetical protein
MKPDVMLEILEAAAAQLSVRVSYEALLTGGIQTGVRGGLCRVKGELRVIIDKRATGEERVATLATALATFDTAELELPKQARELLATYRRQGTGPRRAA